MIKTLVYHFHGVSDRAIGSSKRIERQLRNSGERNVSAEPKGPKGYVIVCVRGDHEVNEHKLRRLFPDYPAVEKAYYRRTGIFPIMHTVVIRRDVYERNPWIATSLYEAFELAKRAGEARIRVTGPLAVALPWLPAHLERGLSRLRLRSAVRWRCQAHRPGGPLDLLLRQAPKVG